MASSFQSLAPWCLVALALAGCAPFDAVAAANAAAAAKQAASVTSDVTPPNPAQATADGRAQAAAGAQASNGKGTGTPPAAPQDPKAPQPPAAPAVGGNTAASGGVQGIAVGEPNPNGGAASGPITHGGPTGGMAILTPCTQSFIKLDTNNDGWIDAKEWAAAGTATTGADAAASFKAKDTDGNGQLDRVEFGCDAPPTQNGQPTGRG